MNSRLWRSLSDRFMFLLCALIHLHSHINGILHSGNAPSLSGFTALIRVLLFRAVVQIWAIWISWLAWEPPVKLEIRCFVPLFFMYLLVLLPLACFTLPVVCLHPDGFSHLIDREPKWRLTLFCLQHRNVVTQVCVWPPQQWVQMLAYPPRRLIEYLFE